MVDNNYAEDLFFFFIIMDFIRLLVNFLLTLFFAL